MVKDNLRELRAKVKALKNAIVSKERRERSATKKAEARERHGVLASTQKAFALLKNAVAISINDGHDDVSICVRVDSDYTQNWLDRLTSTEFVIYTQSFDHNKLLKLCSALARELNCSLSCEYSRDISKVSYCRNYYSRFIFEYTEPFSVVSSCED